jgi:DNA topoisomerase-2
MNGKDAAATRYIYTYICDIARKIFPVDSDGLLEYLNDEGKSIEPTFYRPVACMALINPVKGIATGWSTSIPAYNPIEVVDNIKRMLKKEESKPLHPWYKGFIGSIHYAGNQRYTVYGRIEKINATTIRISELPPGVSTDDYQEFLDKMRGIEYVQPANKKLSKAATTKKKKAAVAAKKKREAVEAKAKKKAASMKNKKDDDTNKKKEKAEKEILDVRANHTNSEISFTIVMTKKYMKQCEEIGLYKKFKVVRSLATSNMVLFDSNGQVKKYNNTTEIEKEFFDSTLKFYYARKEKMIKDYELKSEVLKNKVKYILQYRADNFNLKADDAGLLKQFIKGEYTRFPKVKTVKVVGEIDMDGDSEMKDDSQDEPFDDIVEEVNSDDDDDDDDDEEKKKNIKLTDFQYLRDMKNNAFGERMAKQFQAQYDKTIQKLAKIKAIKPEDMWLEDLDEFLKGIKKHEQDVVDNKEVAMKRTEALMKQQAKKRASNPDVKSPKMRKYVKPETGTFIKPPKVEVVEGVKPKVVKEKKVKKKPDTKQKNKKNKVKKSKKDEDDDIVMEDSDAASTTDEDSDSDSDSDSDDDNDSGSDSESEEDDD